MSNSKNSVNTSYNNFALHLYEKIGKGKDENFFVSPYSIVSALSMCLAGARTNTEQQLKKLLHYLQFSNDDLHKANALLMQRLAQLPGVTLNVANKIYPNVGFKVEKDFTELIGKHYKSEIQQLDFKKAAEAASTINNWVARQTKDKIKELVPQSLINEMVRLILVNAIYFKGNWAQKFNKESTRKEPFHLQDGTTKEVDMMVMLDKKFKLLTSPENLMSDVCRLPYEGNNISMTIILPHEGVKIDKVEASLNAERLNEILISKVLEQKVHVYIPKFKFEKSLEVQILKIDGLRLLSVL
jgi:serpin B